MIEEGNPMSDTPEAERVLKIAAFGFDRPEEAPLDDFPCCSDTELHERNSGTAQSGSEALARLLYRRLYGHEGYAPGIICRELADAILAAGWRPPVAADHPTEPSAAQEQSEVLEIFPGTLDQLDALSVRASAIHPTAPRSGSCQ